MFTSTYTVTDQSQIQSVATDAAALLMTTQLGDIDNPYVIDNHDLLREELTPMQQAHVWLLDGNTGEAERMLGNISSLAFFACI